MAQSEAIVEAAGETFTRFAVVRELGTRKVKANLAQGSSPVGVERLVLERYSPALGLSPQQIDEMTTSARRLMSLRHPNLCLVRDVARPGTDLLVASEYTEGVTFEELRRLSTAKGPIPLEIGLRIIVDVLSGLSALHTHQGDTVLAHGEVSAINVLVGQDGITRMLRPYRGVAASVLVEPDSFGYVAPEVLKGKPADVTSDVFGAGVLLWEVLSRRKLFGKTTREAMASRTVKIPKPVPPADAAWAGSLANVAERALALDPAQRYATAAEMAAALRLIVRSRLAMPPKVADLVDRVASEVFSARRARDAEHLDAEDVAPLSSKNVRPSIPPGAVKALETLRPSTRPLAPTPTAFVHEAPTVPRAPNVPTMLTAAAEEFDEVEPISLGGLIQEELQKAQQPKPATAPPPPPPTPARPSNRPIAPPLELTPPVPPVMATPSSAIAPTHSIVAESTVVEAASEPPRPAPVLAPLAAPSVDEEEILSPLPQRKNRFVPLLIGVGALCVLLIAAAGIRSLLGHPDTQPTPTASATVPPLPTTSAAARPTATTTESPQPTATTVTSVEAAPSASTQPSATATATAPMPTTSGSTKKTPRPRPTYDPEGI